MNRGDYTSHSRFENTLGAQSLPIVGAAARRRDRAHTMRLVVASGCMFWVGVIVTVAVLCG